MADKIAKIIHHGDIIKKIVWTDLALDDGQKPVILCQLLPETSFSQSLHALKNTVGLPGSYYLGEMARKIWINVSKLSAGFFSFARNKGFRMTKHTGTPIIVKKKQLTSSYLSCYSLTVFRIRIRIGSRFNQVSGSGIQIQKGKNDPQK